MNKDLSSCNLKVEKKKRKRAVITSDSEEEEEEVEDKKAKIEQDVEMKQITSEEVESKPDVKMSSQQEDINSKIEAMDVSSQTIEDNKAFDKEIEEAAAEEKEAKEEKMEMMTIIHTL